MPADSAFHLPASPVAALGTITLVLAFLVNGYALAAALVGQRQHRPALVRSALHASWAFTALMCLASSLMVYAFLAHDYSIKYVAHYSNVDMSFFYKLTAYWGGLDGSIMFWVWILAVFSAIALWMNHRRHRDMLGYVIATIAAVAAFFLGVMLYSKNPFSTFLTAVPSDGKGMNPLLQTFWMVIHPPSLYMGYVSMTIPFAFCIGALASGRLDDTWLHSIRVWVMISWFHLSLGLTLGMIWAYEELGWGGYWAWDPVENAGLLPWFTATAFLHSLLIQERRGMMKVWNVVLIIVSFFFTIFGTFMTRSGVVQSVHAFGQDAELAMLFILFMAAILTVSMGLLLYRLPALRSASQLESFWSREFAFLLNNWILLFAAFFVLFATMFPTLSESITGQRITVGAPFFNRVMIPIGLILLLLAGAAPLLAWRVTTRRKLLDQFMFPVGAAALVVGVIATLLPRWRVRTTFLHDQLLLPVSLVCMGLVAFVFATTAQEFLRGMLARRKQTGADPITSLVGIVLTKKRKYGGYIVHLGIALMCLGFAGKAQSFDKQVTVSRVGETFAARDLTLRYDEFFERRRRNYNEFGAKVTVLRRGKVVDVLFPARREYFKGSDDQMTTEVALSRRLDADIYLVLNGFDPRARVSNFTVYLNPLVNWVWLGFGLLAFGTGICLIPESLVTALRPRRRTAAGRAAEALLLALTLGAVTFGLARMARADEPSPAAPAASGAAMQHVEVKGGVVDESSLSPELVRTAHRLFEDLVCLCGGCPKETLAACKCGFAAKEREGIYKLLAGKDVSTPAAQQAAYRQVVDAYIRKFGGVHVLTFPPNEGFNRLSWVIPYVVFAGALALVFFVGRRWVRRGRPAVGPAAVAGAAPGTTTGVATAPASAELEDKLDDELDDID